MLVPHVTSRLFQMICYSQPCVEVFHVRDKPVCIQGQAWPNEAKASENHNVQCVVRSSIDISSSQMISETVIPFHQRLWTGCWVAMCKQWYPAARSVWDVHVPWDFDMGQCLAGNWYDASSKLCKSTIIPYRNGSSDFAWFLGIDESQHSFFASVLCQVTHLSPIMAMWFECQEPQSPYTFIQ